MPIFFHFYFSATVLIDFCVKIIHSEQLNMSSLFEIQDTILLIKEILENWMYQCSILTDLNWRNNALHAWTIEKFSSEAGLNFIDWLQKVN